MGKLIILKMSIVVNMKIIIKFRLFILLFNLLLCDNISVLYLKTVYLFLYYFFLSLNN